VGTYLGLDLGTSAIKATLIDGSSGAVLARASAPSSGEQKIQSPAPGFAEQDPLVWWHHAKEAIAQLRAENPAGLADVAGIGIAYQMHGLVLCDASLTPTRPAIIWCDSRAVEVGESLSMAVGPDYAWQHLLNQPGNFTAAKLAWVAQNQPEVLKGSRWMMLPGDWLAAKLTGLPATTASGLSEMILWDFREDAFASRLFGQAGAPMQMVPEMVPTFGEQGAIDPAVADALGLPRTAKVLYRAGDQPNNALSLGVCEPGEVATTAGTSGVIYGVTDATRWDPEGRVNTFLHVTHTAEAPRRGVLLCLNGAGSLYSWVRRTFAPSSGFAELNALADGSEIGARGVSMLPYGNGAERTLGNRDLGGSIAGLRFADHGLGDLARAAQEGILFAMIDGLTAMAGVGVECKKVRAGRANLFLSGAFAQGFADLTGAELELLESDGALGAALGAGVGGGAWHPGDIGLMLVRQKLYKRDAGNLAAWAEAQDRWQLALKRASVSA
jgi:xylulokinase